MWSLAELASYTGAHVPLAGVSAGRAGGVAAPWERWHCLPRPYPAVSQAPDREFLLLSCLLLQRLVPNSVPHRTGFKNRINLWPEVMGRGSCPSQGPTGSHTCHAPPSPLP